MIPPLLLLIIVTLVVPVPIKASPCLQRPDPGLCRAYIPRYFFNATSGTCQLFIWGGCRGNVPFETLQECQSARCKANRPNTIAKRNNSTCRQRPNSGPCRAFSPRYFYNQTSESCQLFIWGGCRGVVPFDTFQQCQQTCLDYADRSDGCTRLPDRGPCHLSIRKVFFNQETNRCERFKWGGCHGNVPFDTLQQCKAARCGTQVELFTQEPDPDPSEEAETGMIW